MAFTCKCGKNTLNKVNISTQSIESKICQKSKTLVKRLCLSLVLFSSKNFAGDPRNSNQVASTKAHDTECFNP